ncbi:hypothetical protein Y032_0314g2255 [Ancylostoma ceylanicum]|uniref:MARVEL domain-containing protein n=1 Tax=Ancylostoma ceylanicum TaxID=53326 RepID=A0A016S2A3_9BILA|nr:hypothetical protein Y032_0314g2255 [Ancylostoma ceylanicum]
MSTAASQSLTGEGDATVGRRRATRNPIHRQSTVSFARLAHKHMSATKTTSNVAVVALAVFYIAMAVIGFMNIDNCPVREEIPIWMIVAALASLINIANHFYKLYKESRNQPHPMCVRISDGLLLVFRPVWFIAGCIWVYTAYENVTFDTFDKNNYCDQLTYYIALVISTIFCVIVCFVLACLCCACCYVVFQDSDDADDDDNDVTEA